MSQKSNEKELGSSVIAKEMDKNEEKWENFIRDIGWKVLKHLETVQDLNVANQTFPKKKGDISVYTNKERTGFAGVFNPETYHEKIGNIEFMPRFLIGTYDCPVELTPDETIQNPYKDVRVQFEPQINIVDGFEASAVKISSIVNSPKVDKVKLEEWLKDVVNFNVLEVFSNNPEMLESKVFGASDLGGICKFIEDKYRLYLQKMTRLYIQFGLKDGEK